MRRTARVAAVVGLAVALGGASAPVAMADVIFVNEHRVGPFVSERGPGDLAFNHVEDSIGVPTSQGDKSVDTGDLVSKILGKHNKGVFEIEGAEQDQGEK
ncbi:MULTISPECIES: hypothetical protein [Streptomyces]|uniref:Uncharacterized protein n=1 Tax=Streptomyces cacaoi TaxID=1898 RepID=A0A4Y3R7V4_STRCI|nr:MULTISPECIES: hypothetical protein [Streptomyces]NNG84609.1 hypothetical protein [Streptomyces cacaoi]GEB51930.1 hypothetical protein SCA03_44810 [Streptomyces cacaoi]